MAANKTETQAAADIIAIEPRWPALLAILAVGALYSALPGALRLGPYWLLLAVVCVLMIPTAIAHRTGRHKLNKERRAVLQPVNRITAGFVQPLIPTHKPCLPRRGIRHP